MFDGMPILKWFCIIDGLVCFSTTFAVTIGFFEYILGMEYSVAALVLLGCLIYVTVAMILTKSKY